MNIQPLNNTIAQTSFKAQCAKGSYITSEDVKLLNKKLKLNFSKFKEDMQSSKDFSQAFSKIIPPIFDDTKTISEMVPPIQRMLGNYFKSVTDEIKKMSEINGTKLRYIPIVGVFANTIDRQKPGGFIDKVNYSYLNIDADYHYAIKPNLDKYNSAIEEHSTVVSEVTEVLDACKQNGAVASPKVIDEYEKATKILKDNLKTFKKISENFQGSINSTLCQAEDIKSKKLNISDLTSAIRYISLGISSVLAGGFTELVFRKVDFICSLAAKTGLEITPLDIIFTSPEQLEKGFAAMDIAIAANTNTDIFNQSNIIFNNANLTPVKSLDEFMDIKV